MSDLEIKPELEIINEEEINEQSKIEVKPNKTINYIMAVVGVFCIITLAISIYSINTINNMSKQLISLNEQIDFLEERLNINVKLTESLFTYESSAYLDISSPSSGFDYARNKSGTFLVSLKDISPHLNGGYKASITIGNMSNASFNGFKIKYQWGFLENAEQIKELSFTENLSPGSWNNVTAYLSAPPQEGENLLRINIETDLISLKTK